MPRTTYAGDIRALSSRRRIDQQGLHLRQPLLWAGIGDYGLKLAGGRCLGACEIDPHRRAVHEANIAAERLWGDIREDAPAIAAHFASSAVDLVMLTPPCQSFSTANARRGNRELPDDADKDHRNGLFFVGLDVVKAIRPKVVVFENVPNFLERLVRDPSSGKVGKIQDLIELHLEDYVGITLVTCFSKPCPPRSRSAPPTVLRRSRSKNQTPGHRRQLIRSKMLRKGLAMPTQRPRANPARCSWASSRHG
ncbi:DNA cytosine methyltransferase [Stenotrophomonas sp. CFBP 13724]|nr:DNA cytosine methyltransferase [Stenotrophomonas sp. CFBP 13724]